MWGNTATPQGAVAVGTPVTNRSALLCLLALSDQVRAASVCING